MVVSRTLRASSCAACRVSLLRCFTSAPANSFRAQQHSTRQALYIRTAQQIRRSTNQADNGHEKGLLEHKIAEVEVDEAENEDLEGEDALIEREADSESLPWYLQDDAPKIAPRPFSDRQRIPELPENPPPLLQPLLQQISVDLGVDDLSLLDMRKLDPPPALGANLIMIIGTTRSEKHLHVSADRLCRWLRSNYQLRPDADGLLGRNELKLKLKRKAKRQKLMGSANDASADDGVRTGWVCVDVGVVEEGSDKTVPRPRDDFVGFGRQTEGVRIVVQMLTEEKREEIDLEKLWGGIIEKGGVMELEEEFDGEVRMGIRDSLQQGPPAPNYKPLGGNWSNGISPILSKTRKFHSSARRLSSQLESHLATVPDFDVYHRYGFGSLQNIQESLHELFASGQYEKARADLLEFSKQEPLLQNGEWRRFLLNNLRIHLENMPKERALVELGEGETDHESTAFLRCFYQTVTSFPNQAGAEARVWLCCWADSQQHAGYSVPSLIKLFEEIQESGVAIGTGPHLDLLERILQQTTGPSFNYYGPPPHVMKHAIQVLQTMSHQGLSVLNQDVLLRLQQFTAPGLEENVPPHLIHTDGLDTFNLPSRPMIALQKRIHMLITNINLPLFDESTRLSLMEIYASQHNWVEFWEIWRMAARHGKARSAELYASMFVLVATTQHQNGCQTVLRNWVAELAKESPPVKIEGNVALAIKYCLQVADPNVEEDFLENPDHLGEWVRIWKRCTTEGVDEQID